MPDGSMIMDAPVISPTEIKPKISVPTGKFESPTLPLNEQGHTLQQYYDAFLNIPTRLDPNHQNRTGRQLADFLTDRGYIKTVKLWNRSWGFGYVSNDKAIYISELDMPRERYDYFVFRLGTASQNGERLYPQPDEMDQYRFLHEVSHGYQDYAINRDGAEDWHDRALNGDINSSLSTLFSFCYQTRSENPGRGITTWGNQPDYNTISDNRSQIAIRAHEDANELVTMYLWSPEYFDTYLNYLSGNIPGYGESNLAQDGLAQLPNSKKELLKQVVLDYVDEMKRIINT